MDRAVRGPSAVARWLRRAGLGALLLVPVIGWVGWFGQRPAQAQWLQAPQLAEVRAGEFRDELALRARAEPLRSVQLDAPEAGRVEAVLARDGDQVQAGTPLYRLQSPEQEQLLLQRGAEVAQQMANVSVQRSAQAASLAANRRELAQLQAGQQQAEAEWARQSALAAEGFVSTAALEQAERAHRLASQLLQQARADQQAEAQTRAQSIAEMARAVQGLQRGLQWLAQSRERLLQRAPMAGQISGLALQVGASVRPGDRLGRIDDLASGMQWVAEVDEYYLPRLQAGLRARSDRGPLTLAQTLPQVQGGKVRVLLRGAEGAAAVSSPPAPAARPGQALAVQLQLSAPTPALLLAEGPGVQPWLYVKSGASQGAELQRRQVRLGRRAAGQVEVLAGLQAGDVVLISQPPSDAERLRLP